MTDVDLQTLNTFLLPDLGEVILNPNITSGSPPPLTPSVPSIMSSPELVPSSNYRWEYNSVRHLRMGYVLERGGFYETGEFDVISKAIYQAAIDPSTYIPSDLYFHQTVLRQTNGDVGVSFSVDTSVESDSLFSPQFGLTYRIISTLPAAYPTVRVFIIKLLPII
jgi:hypothetical protein